MQLLPVLTAESPSTEAQIGDLLEGLALGLRSDQTPALVWQDHGFIHIICLNEAVVELIYRALGSTQRRHSPIYPHLIAAIIPGKRDFAEVARRLTWAHMPHLLRT